MRNILVPVDFSQHSKCAFEIAYDLALRIKSKLNVIHVIENPKTSTLLPDLYLQEIPTNKNLNEKLANLAKEKLLKWASMKPNGVELNIHTSVGDLFDEFKNYTRSNKPDLVIMGIKGYNEKNLNTIGSFTERMINKSEFTILIVKAGYAKKAFINVMMVADFIKNEANVALEIKRLNNLFGAQIALLHINTPQDFISDNMIEDNFKAFEDKYQLEDCRLFTYNHSNKEQGIILAAKKLNADMIAIASQAKSILERLIPIPSENKLEDSFIDYLDYPIWLFRPQFKLPDETGSDNDEKSFKFFRSLNGLSTLFSVLY